MSNSEFIYTKEALTNLANDAIDLALKKGATEVQVEFSENISRSVDVLHGKTENFDNSHETQLTINILIGKNRGNVGVTHFSKENLDQLIQQALDIAKYTQPDDANGLAEKEFLCTKLHEDLGLYNPHQLSNIDLIQSAIDLEQQAISQSNKISNSDGASSHCSSYQFVMANSHGFCEGYQTTNFGKSVTLIGNNGTEMQTDYWYTNDCNYSKLLQNLDVATKAANRLIRRLTKGKINSGKYPVIFEYPLAKSLIRSYCNAISGGNLYRKLSFLNESMGTQVFPEWIQIDEDPFIYGGSASSYFDNEGVIVKPRQLVTDGTVNGYLLSSYSARKLDMNPTGNAGGPHNLIVKPNFSGSIHELAKQLNTGLIIIETIGHGLNLVTGDYSVGASGLWVQNGEIQYFTDNLTIAGNMLDMFKQIQLIADDCEIGSIKCGSMLIDNMTVSS